MNLEIKCTGCGRVLLVPVDYTGLQVQCPSCRATIALQTAAAVPNSPPPASPRTPLVDSGEVVSAEIVGERETVDSTRYRLRTPEGQVYGPVSRTELDAWVQQGRISHECEIDDGSEWQPADVLYPMLATVDPTPTSPVPESSMIPNEPYDFRLPHRGRLVLGLAICGLVIWCPVLSIMAWVVGSSDLIEMEAGRRDPNGRLLTKVGRNLGMVLAIGWIVAAGIGTIGLLYFAGSYS